MNLSEVVVQVFVSDSPLVSLSEPSLQQRCHTMNARHKLPRRLRATSQHGYAMLVAFLVQATVPLPTIGVYHATKRDALALAGIQTLGRGVLDPTHLDSAHMLARFLVRRNQCLALRLATADALFKTIQVRFADVDSSAQRIL